MFDPPWMMIRQRCAAESSSKSDHMDVFISSFVRFRTIHPGIRTSRSLFFGHTLPNRRSSPMSPITGCQDERRSRLLDAMPAIAWSASAQTFRFTYINPAAETLLGYPVEHWLEDEHFWIEHLHPEDRFVATFCHNETLAARDHELVYRMIAADGRDRKSTRLN